MGSRQLMSMWRIKPRGVEDTRGMLFILCPAAVSRSLAHCSSVRGPAQDKGLRHDTKVTSPIPITVKEKVRISSSRLLSCPYSHSEWILTRVKSLRRTANIQGVNVSLSCDLNTCNSYICAK